MTVLAQVDKSSGGDPADHEMTKSSMIARNVLREELGEFGPWNGAGYSFDQPTRDRLLAHGRQDAAAEFTMANIAFREAYQARVISKQVRSIVVALLVLNVVVLALLWFR